MPSRAPSALPSLALLALSCPVWAQQDAGTLPTVVVTAPAGPGLGGPALGAVGLSPSQLQRQRSASNDTATLLLELPGTSSYGAGGVSSLPVLRGLADDRLRVQLDGMDLMPACPNHMNPVLSYIDPSQVGKVTVYAGVTPVSVGGDNLGGTVQIESQEPDFAAPGQALRLQGELGSAYRSNGNARSANAAFSVANESLNLHYSASSAQSDNYSAARGFKAAGAGQVGGPWLLGQEVGSSAYRSINQNIGLALRHEGHLLQFDLGEQDIPFEGFPNQRMDMTSNRNTIYNLRYSGLHDWGELKARLYRQDTRHQMNMGSDRDSYGTGMPMNTQATTLGSALQGQIELASGERLRLGTEFQHYQLYDWWPPVGGSMGPNSFFNINGGVRNKTEAFVEWESHQTPHWTTLLGLRGGRVSSSTGQVQGYNDSLAALWGNDAAAFNAQNTSRRFNTWDATALARFTPSDRQSYEFGLARKTRAPNLYQLYPWSTQAMAALMNNFVGDGNGYIGNPQLKAEVANTASVSGDWHEADRWGVKASAYYTYISGYIDAQRCGFSQCSASNASTSSGFVLLQYANQSARLYGLDLSAQGQLLNASPYGDVTLAAVLNLLRGSNTRTGDGLYNTMPPNLKLTLQQRLGPWTHALEWQAVMAKTHVSQVRNEMPTPGYALVHLRSSYAWKDSQLDFGVDNLFNRFYDLPLGGAYLGQGSSMSSNGIPWGVPVPGKGRSLNVGYVVRF